MGNRRFVCSLVVLLGCATAQAAPFVNLNFEQATVPPGSQFFLPASLAFPGWTPRVGEAPLSTVYYNQTGIGEAAVTLYDMRLPISDPVLEGTYSAFLITDFAFGTPASLAQTGSIPANAQSLRLLVSQSRLPPVLTFNAIQLPLVRLSSPMGPDDPIMYGADVTSLAGVEATLRLASSVAPSLGVTGFDAITFSTLPIPELTSWWQLVPLTLAALGRRWTCRSLSICPRRKSCLRHDELNFHDSSSSNHLKKKGDILLFHLPRPANGTQA
jgi:hypothetical protein